MRAASPKLDGRRASELYDELTAIASIALPEWRHAETGGDFATALFKIVSQLGEHVTGALAKTPTRDEIAFFNMLDIPADAPRPATAPLVFLLADKQDDPVFTLARTQVTASLDEGEALFETTTDIHLAPGRLMFMAATDGDSDTIELQPPNFSILEAPEGPIPSFTVATFARSGSETLQVEPIEGLDKDDVVRLDGVAYSVIENDNGLITLDAGLEAAANPDTSSIEKVTRFDLYTLRNQQQHAVYIGHDELFNLEEPTIIYLDIDPPAVASTLDQSSVEWSMFGTLQGTEEPQWHTLSAVVDQPGQLKLTKAWRGAVEESEEPGQKNLWLRAKYIDPITQATVENTKARNISIRVKTSSAPAQSSETADIQTCPCGDAQSNETSEPEQETISEPDLIEGSTTIDQAFNNATPLPLTSRFLPFGPEPRRFDTFALAAPEVFSKKGATVEIDVQLSDATIVTMNIAQRINGGGLPRVYAVSRNGRLQVIRFDADGSTWEALGNPEIADLDTPSDSVAPRDIELDAGSTPEAVQLDANTDLVVVRDRRGQLWARIITLTGSAQTPFTGGSWSELRALPGDTGSRDFLLLAWGDSTVQPFYDAVVVTVSGTALYRGGLRLNGSDVTALSWIAIGAAGPEPVWNESCRLTPVFEKQWPDLPFDFPLSFLALDADQKLWTTEIDQAPGFVTWTELPVTLTGTIDPTVRPAAGELADGSLVVYAAENNADTLTPFSHTALPAPPTTTPFSPLSPIELTAGSTFQLYPGALVTEPLAVIAGTLNGQTTVSGFTRTEELFTLNPPPEWQPPGAPTQALLIPDNGVPALVFNGDGETLFRQRLATPWTEAGQFQLFSALVLPDAFAGADYIDPDPGSNVLGKLIDFPIAPELTDGAQKIYALDSADADVAALGFAPATGAAAPWGLWSSGPDLAGTASDEVPPTSTLDPRLLIIDTSNHIGTPSSGDALRINGARYWVTDTPAANTVQVDRSIPSVTNIGDPITYQQLTPTTGASTVIIQPEHIATLLKTGATATVPQPPYTLHFASDTQQPDPAIQAITHQEIVAGDQWVLLTSAWNTEPDNTVTVALVGAVPDTWTTVAFERGYQNPELAWEYFDGRSWRRLEQDFVDGTNRFASSGSITFTAPNDLAPGEVAGQEDLWIRARLVGGDYGSAEYIVESTGPIGSPPKTTQTVTVNTSNLQPPEIYSIQACFKLETAVPAQMILVNNNLTQRDQTQASQAPDATFELFEGVRKVNGPGKQRVLYLGFSKNFAASPLSLFVDAEDQPGDVTLQFETYTEKGWRSLSHDDETHGFYRRGYVRVSIDRTPLASTLFSQNLYWLRVRPRLADEWNPQLRGLFANAAPAEQAESVVQELLGSSTGEPGFQLSISKTPVLPDSLELRVQENLTDEERVQLMADSEGLEDTQIPVTSYPDLSLGEDWVLWRCVDSFIGEKAEARVYRLDPLSGSVVFSRDAKPPPPGQDNVRAIRYQTGGGTRGNVDAFAINTLKSAVDGIETVANPTRAAGGTDTPAVEVQIADAPARIRSATQALTPPDIEAMAVSTSPLIVRARCLFPDAIGAPIRLALAVDTGEPCPQPTLADKDAVAKIVHERGWGALAPDELIVSGPEYLWVRLVVRLRAVTTDQAAGLENAAHERLRTLLDPIKGGPNDRGWPFARQLYQSDVLQALALLPGFDQVENMELSAIEGSLEQMSPLSMVCALPDDISVSVVLGSGG